MPGRKSPPSQHFLLRSRTGWIGAILVLATSLTLAGAIAPGLWGGHHGNSGPAFAPFGTNVNGEGRLAEAASVRSAAPPAGIQADPAVPQSSAVVPGERWAAAGINFVIEGQEWDALSLANVDQALSELPAGVLTALGNRDLGGVSILVNRSGRTLSGKQPYGQAANFFSTNDSRNELVLFPDQSPPTILHELGHAYNLRREPAGRYALVLLEPEMQSFMAATGWRLQSSTGQVQAARDQTTVDFAYSGAFTWPRLSHNDPLEDFANSFALYFSGPDDLKAQSPERFSWFDANIGR